MDERWTVRGVPAEVQRRVREAAEAEGVRVGRWVERALLAALENGVGQPEDAAVVARMTRLEERVAALTERLAVIEAAPTTRRDDQAQATRAATSAPTPKTADTDRPVYVTGGDGTRRRLTPEGVALVEQLVRDGVSDAEIAAKVGMDRGAIRQRRLKMTATPH